MSRNPKHAKSRAGIKIYARKHRRFRSMRGMIITIVILATIITGLVAVVIFNPNENILFVDVGDTVTVKYTLWLSDENWDQVEEKEAGEFDILMEATARDTGLIHGFWFAVLGMAEGEIDDGVYLEACVDDLQSPPALIHPLAVAGDDWDDRDAPGVTFCQSYGSGELRFTRLIFKIEIISIEKGS